MKGFKEYMMTAITAQKTKKCPPGYRFSKKLKVCVPIGQQRVYYPFFGYRNGGNGNNNQNQNGNFNRAKLFNVGYSTFNNL